MARFYGNHPGTRQVRGSRKVKPATAEERLASMQHELDRRLWYRPINHEYVQAQLDAIANLKRKSIPEGQA